MFVSDDGSIAILHRLLAVCPGARVDHCPCVPSMQNWSARRVLLPYSHFTFFSLQLYSQSHVSANACILRLMSPLVLEASVRLRIKVIGLAPSFTLVQRPMSKCSKESGFLFSPIVILGEQLNQISFSCWIFF